MGSIANAQLELTQALAATLLHSVWQVAVLAVAAAILFRLLSGRSAALRHLVGMSVLGAMALLPVVTFFQIALRPGESAGSARAAEIPVQLFGAAPGMIAAPSGGWAVALVMLWLAGVAAMLIRLGGGLWWIDRLAQRSSQTLPAEWRARFETLQRQMGVTRDIAIHVAQDILVPFTARVLRPVIWLPAELLARMPREQIEALLAHELAHIHRQDWLWNGLQCVVEALLFFHPGMWWLSRRIRGEREAACDDLAVAAQVDKIDLAEALTALAREAGPSERLLLAANAGALANRLERLLAFAPARAQSWEPFGLMLLLSAGFVTAATLAPRDTPAVFAGTLEFSQSRAANEPQTPSAGEQIMRIAEAGYLTLEQAVFALEKVARKVEIALQTKEQASNRDARLTVPVAPSAPVSPVALTERPIDAVRTNQAIVRIVSADPSVKSKLGTPVVVTSDGYTGRWGIKSNPVPHGYVRIAFTLAGPNGEAEILATAVSPKIDGRWTLTNLDMTGFKPRR